MPFEWAANLTSDGIKHFHSNAIEQAYRERFKAERRSA